MKNSKLEEISLFVLRVLIGWHLMYEGLFKLFNPAWTSSGFLMQSHGFMAGVYQWIAGNGAVLNTVDILNTWGLILIGAGLILGLFTRTAAWAGALLLLLYYLGNPPLLGVTTPGPAEGNYLLVNKTLIEAVTLFVLGTIPAATSYGLDILIGNKKDHKND